MGCSEKLLTTQPSKSCQSLAGLFFCDTIPLAANLRHFPASQVFSWGCSRYNAPVTAGDWIACLILLALLIYGVYAVVDSIRTRIIIRKRDSMTPAQRRQLIDKQARGFEVLPPKK